MRSASSYEKRLKEHEKSMATLASNHIKELPHLLDRLDTFLLQWPIVEQATSSIGIRPSYVLPMVLSVVMLFFGWFDDILTNAVGFFYPAWQSFKAVESKRTDDDKQWLTYWVVFAAFSIIEMFSSVLLFWIPFYYVLKISFLLWLLLPQFQGAKFVYNRAVRPFLLLHQDKIDRVMDRINNSAEQLVGSSPAPGAPAAASGPRRRLAPDDGAAD